MLSEEFGQEHAHLLAVRAQRAAAGDTYYVGLHLADYKATQVGTFGNRNLLFQYEQVQTQPMMDVIFSF